MDNQRERSDISTLTDPSLRYQHSEIQIANNICAKGITK